jgi:hypothetical protein
MQSLRLLTLLVALYSAAQGQSWTFTTLYSFQGGTDGSFANSLVAANGVLYGTTGGPLNPHCGTCGTVFQLTPPAVSGGAWTHTVLFGFSDPKAGGSFPNQPTMTANGALVATTYAGGAGKCGSLGCGTAFSLTPGAAGWTETVLLNFGGGTGGGPSGRLRVGPAGTLVGTTSHVAFALHPPAGGTGAWRENTLYTFSGANQDANGPTEGLVPGNNGALYGVATDGGAFNLGAVYQLMPPATPPGPWIETVLYSFQGGTDGSVPEGPLAISSTGTLYGTTLTGGMPSCFMREPQPGCGTVYQLTPPATAGAAWQETVLYAFSDGTDGGYPVAGVKIRANGVLAGTTAYGGMGACLESCGTVFQLTPPATPGGAWTETVLHSFPDSAPAGPILMADPNAPLYGVTYTGGAYGYGQVFELAP